jgi:NADH-quinone oxidoreductase subunit G
LVTWKQLIGVGTLQIGEPYLAAGARVAVARISAATAAAHGLADGHIVSISSATGTIQLEVAVTQMPDDVVWVPANAPGIALGTDLAAGWGDTVQLAAGHLPVQPVTGGEA